MGVGGLMKIHASLRTQRLVAPRESQERLCGERFRPEKSELGHILTGSREELAVGTELLNMPPMRIYRWVAAVS